MHDRIINIKKVTHILLKLDGNRTSLISSNRFYANVLKKSKNTERNRKIMLNKKQIDIFRYGQKSRFFGQN